MDHGAALLRFKSQHRHLEANNSLEWILLAGSVSVYLENYNGERLRVHIALQRPAWLSVQHSQLAHNCPTLAPSYPIFLIFMGTYNRHIHMIKSKNKNIFKKINQVDSDWGRHMMSPPGLHTHRHTGWEVKVMKRERESTFRPVLFCFLSLDRISLCWPSWLQIPRDPPSSLSKC